MINKTIFRVVLMATTILSTTKILLLIGQLTLQVTNQILEVLLDKYITVSSQMTTMTLKILEAISLISLHKPIGLILTLMVVVWIISRTVSISQWIRFKKATPIT